MKYFGTSMVGMTAAFAASAATTLSLLWFVVSLSEPQRSQLQAATSARQMVNQREAAVAKVGPVVSASE
jgi:hypothetical protein